MVTEQGELTDPEADLMTGLQFAARNVSRIALKPDAQALRAGTSVTVAVKNPDLEALRGRATWLLDASAFSVQPESVTLEIPPGATRSYHFLLQALREGKTLQSLPQLEFNVVTGTTRHRFHREVRFLQEISTPYRATAPVLDGNLTD